MAAAAVPIAMEFAKFCNDALDTDSKDSALALQLKGVGVGVIFIAGMLGVSLPFLGRGLRFLSTEGDVFFVSRAFAAGVILATGFVHILPEGVEALKNPCLPKFWSSFPLCETVAMVSALITLLVDNLWTGYYEHSHQTNGGQSERQPLLGTSSTSPSSNRQFQREKSVSRLGSHADAIIKIMQTDDTNGINQQVQEIVVAGEHHLTKQEETHIRNVVILQVLEFFEGFALGGSICQAGFDWVSSSIRAGIFAVTTPLGIIVGIGIASSYRADTAQAVIVEGLFDSASAGILIYMALVALIATDFRSDRIRGNRQLGFLSYLALFAGAFAMSALAIWA